MAKIKIFNTNLHVNNSLFSSFYDRTNPVNNTYDGHNLISETFVSKKLRRFIFPQHDTLDPKWMVGKISPFQSLLHLINLTWDRLSHEEMTTWNSMCQRYVNDKEISNEGHLKQVMTSEWMVTIISGSNRKYNLLIKVDKRK